MTRLTSIQPHWAVEGGRVTIHGSGFPVDKLQVPVVTIGDATARTVYASPNRISVLVPAGLDGGRTTVRVADVPGETALLDVGTPLATGLHQVDNPVFDRDGNLYVTYSDPCESNAMPCGLPKPEYILSIAPDAGSSRYT